MLRIDRRALLAGSGAALAASLMNQPARGLLKPTPCYLAPYTGTGARDNPFRPPCDIGLGSIDLRPDPTKVEGRAVVCLPEHDTDPRLEKLADDPAEMFGRVARGHAGRRLRVPGAVDLADMLRRILFANERLNSQVCQAAQFNHQGFREIWLAGRLVAIEHGGVLDLAAVDPSDNFNRANANPLDGLWAAVNGGLQIVTNQVKQVSDNFNICRRTDVAAADQRSNVVLIANGDTCGPACRASSVAMTFYLTKWGGGGNLFAKYIAGTQTSLGGTAPGNTANDNMSCEAVGSSINAYRNNVLQTGSPVTDTSITSGFQAIYVDFSGTAILDDWDGTSSGGASAPASRSLLGVGK